MRHDVKDLNDAEAIVVLQALANDLEIPNRTWSMDKNRQNLLSFQKKIERIRGLCVGLLDSCDEANKEERTRNRNRG